MQGPKHFGSNQYWLSSVRRSTQLPFRMAKYGADYDLVVQERFALAAAVPFPMEIIPAATDTIDYKYIAEVKAFNAEWLFESMQVPVSWALGGRKTTPKKGWPVFGAKNVVLIQNPGWNKTAINSMCRAAVTTVCKEHGKVCLLDDMTEKAVFERLKRQGSAVALYPEMEVFLDSLNAKNKLTEARFLDFYHGGSWHYTNKENELKETYEVVEECLMPVGGGIQPEKWYPRKWKAQLSGLFQRFRELPSHAKAFYYKDLRDEEENKECSTMVYNVVNNVYKSNTKDKTTHTLGEGVQQPFWEFYDQMSALKDVHRADPIISSGAAKMQQEVVRSMEILHHMHCPEDAPVEIPLFIFEFAKKEVTYFNKVANIGRPPQVGNANILVDPNDNVLTVVSKKVLLSLRGQKISGTDAARMTSMSSETLQKWFVQEGAPLVRAGIVKLNMNSNGFSVEKLPPPTEASQLQEFERVLLKESNVTLQEYTAALEPPRKRRAVQGTSQLQEGCEANTLGAAGAPANLAASMPALQFGSVVAPWRPPPPMLPGSTQALGSAPQQGREHIAASAPYGQNFGYGGQTMQAALAHTPPLANTFQSHGPPQAAAGSATGVAPAWSLPQWRPPH
jgi:hypothetical protein